jgi:hypothetical protein
MKDADKIFFYVSLRVLRSYSIVQSESRCPPTFIYALERDHWRYRDSKMSLRFVGRIMDQREMKYKAGLEPWEGG